MKEGGNMNINMNMYMNMNMNMNMNINMNMNMNMIEQNISLNCKGGVPIPSNRSSSCVRQ